LASTWETDSGPTLHLAELNGRVRLISMFYATCEGVCVITKQDMQAIEASLPASVRERVGFILVTLDPRRDSLAALRSYRRTEGLAKDRWTLLRGDDAATAKLASVLGVASGRDAAGRFVHSSELVVLDASGRIIHRHAGLRADLQAIATEMEAAALAPSVTPGPLAARH
jgi:protein SCO1/2